MKPAPKLDTSQPNAAWIWNCLLGGKDNYGVDQEVVHRIRRIAPDARTVVWWTRQFLLQAARRAAEAGVDQFLDLGAGIPFSPDVHEAIHEVDPSARIVAVDYDPIVEVHCDAMWCYVPGMAVLRADIREPAALLDQLREYVLIDFTRPVAVLMGAVLDQVSDAENPAQIIAELRENAVAGSYFVLTHLSDDSDPDLMNQTSTDTADTPAQLFSRSADTIAEWLTGLDLIAPGIAPVQDWLDDALPPTRLAVVGGIGLTPSPAPTPTQEQPRRRLRHSEEGTYARY
ncbi:SAM-dependent methyltransferase [Nocardia iowensis]|uniref:SAM-dependent methyltransferase n=1 Tax=Nocardia iowensis TaxID=204891 RepID=A0ABX8S1G1_NOCIO|nr:SAM-dependent methyltransferase [Nocardia iowensis]